MARALRAGGAVDDIAAALGVTNVSAITEWVAEADLRALPPEECARLLVYLTGGVPQC
ncbi:hypothetical protein AB0J35_40465 [Nonomuraea angiospora]|uniref:hypothetical protein n=1 Tax=Nonomuraea angiospora TaxID=46172 RepID=UPI003444A8F4